MLPGQEHCPGRGSGGQPTGAPCGPVCRLGQGRGRQVAGGTGLKTNVHARLSPAVRMGEVALRDALDILESFAFI